MHGELVSRNVTVNGHRTSLRLERATWEALEEIAANEGKSIHEVCSMVEDLRRGSSRTAAVRAFIVTYYRTAATNAGASFSGVIASILPVAGGG